MLTKQLSIVYYYFWYSDIA